MWKKKWKKWNETFRYIVAIKCNREPQALLYNIVSEPINSETHRCRGWDREATAASISAWVKQHSTNRKTHFSLLAISVVVEYDWINITKASGMRSHAISEWASYIMQRSSTISFPWKWKKKKSNQRFPKKKRKWKETKWKEKETMKTLRCAFKESTSCSLGERSNTAVVKRTKKAFLLVSSKAERCEITPLSSVCQRKERKKEIKKYIHKFTKIRREKANLEHTSL